MKKQIAKLYAEQAASIYEVDVDDIFQPTRGTRNTTLARFHVYSALRDRGWSYPQIGEVMGRDHATVISGVRQYKEKQNGSYIRDNSFGFSTSG